jgi:signal transduction histidine kinase
MPLYGADGEKAFLLSVKLSLNIVDDLVRSNLFWSYIWLAITVLIVILVLAANTQLFQYASLYKKLQDVDKMKDDFISMASHELRAPITAIRGYLSLFLEDAYGKFEEKPKQAMSIVMAISTHLATLVEDLLDVSRIEQGRMTAEYENLAVEGIIEELVGQMHFEAEKKKLAFDYKKPASPLPMISADRSRLKQVLINLMSNAIKYTPSGSVTITSELKDGVHVEIKIIDTGLGMSAEARERLFQKFFRVKTEETAMIPGTGLGLWITKQIVEMMGGKIYCDSIEKVGTQMSVIFPAIKALKAASVPVKKS